MEAVEVFRGEKEKRDVYLEECKAIGKQVWWARGKGEGFTKMVPPPLASSASSCTHPCGSW